jgi:carbon-monoxide dehydrogenase medium subunit
MPNIAAAALGGDRGGAARAALDGAMKPIAFDYEKPGDLASAIALLAGANGEGKVVAGGQSLGPMLNLRLAQPRLLVDVRGIEALSAVEESADATTIGAAVTHAAIEDGRVAAPTGDFLRFVAADIAYRAVRNRGTIGGSLAHADPAADWLTALLLLDASVLVEGSGGRRTLPAAEFVTGPFQTSLAADEIAVAVRIPKLSRAARWGYYKFCRKPGEFAEAIGAVLHDPERGIARAVIGATGGAPHVVASAADLLDGGAAEAALRMVVEAGLGEDAYERQVHVVALKRAAERLMEWRSP